MTKLFILFLKSRIFLFLVLITNVYFANVICIETNGLRIIGGYKFIVILMIYFLTQLYVFSPSSFKTKHIIKLLYCLNISILLITLFHVNYYEWNIRILIFDIFKIKVREFKLENYILFMKMLKTLNNLLLLNFVFIETLIIYKLFKQSKDAKL